MFKDISSIFHIIIKLHSAELNFHNDAWQYLWMHNKDIPFANFRLSIIVSVMRVLSVLGV